MRHDNYVSRRALDLFRNHGYTLDDAIIQAGSEYEERLRQRGILDADEKPGRIWTPPAARGRMVGSERNNG
jgi:hypothetical protein